MPTFKHYTTKQLDTILKRINESIYTEVGRLEITAWCTREPLPFSERKKGTKRELAIGDKWGDLFDCAWFHFRGTVPKSAAGKKVVLLLDVNGEMCLFDNEGNVLRGLTSVNCIWEFELTGVVKRVFHITDRAQGGEKIDVWADAGCNDLFGFFHENGTIRQAAIAICDDQVRALYYDFEVLLDFLKILPQNTARYQQILTALNDAAHRLIGSDYKDVKNARKILTAMLDKRGGDPSLNISAVGHAHMDMAWLWPIRETIRKGARTFSTVIYLMERYPDYIFGASQAQYYLWMKEHYPTLYGKIKEKVKQRRIEIQGAMWVEADTNLTGGESLIRQLLYGKRFFKKEFNEEVTNCWIPDVFGYTASLPQILKKAGVDYFATQKLSWSLINTFPHHSFHWQGIDGSSVITHMFPEDTYNSPAAPSSVDKIEKEYLDKDVSKHALMVFGIGDGGGGPGAEHLERLARMKNLAGLHPVKQERAKDFFEKWRRDAERFPTWIGELYLERHQGTFTTNARNKWFNRKIELALRELEWTSIIHGLINHSIYPGERLETIWREVLLYQFHDILPGSSIKRVYDESLARYQELLREVTTLAKENIKSIADKIDTSPFKKPVVIFNSLSWERKEWLKINNNWFHVTVPALGYKTIDSAPRSADQASVKVTENQMENEILKIIFDQNGAIISIYDKQHKREVICQGGLANRLAVYADMGDAWDIPLDYAEVPPRYMKLISSTTRSDGPKAIMEQTYEIGHSRLKQEIVLTANSRRIDFVNKLTWRETGTMLRTSFPVSILAEEATYEIQFGHLRRPTHQNTSWDLAKDEVPAHKWADLSQRDYGVALLNDSKYGYKIKGNVLDLNLLRSVPYPGAKAVKDEEIKAGEPHHGFTDQCDHVFTYALYPHGGDFIEGGVIRQGYELNIPLQVIPVNSQQGNRPSEISFVEVDKSNIIVETIKKAEDHESIILRLYEAEHARTKTKIRFAIPLKKVEEVNLMEDVIGAIHHHGDNEIELEFRPFEIKSIRVITE